VKLAHLFTFITNKFVAYVYLIIL